MGMQKVLCRAVGTWGRVGPTDFNRPVNPIPTRVTDYANHIATSSLPPNEFLDLPTALLCYFTKNLTQI